mmetsp:Transcript_19589/g.16173  ORF Transcript_19589/g.16173 Transcript_19589/m.16173 type:complete len:136 (-) Transcript_19589:19-426(-)
MISKNINIEDEQIKKVNNKKLSNKLKAGLTDYLVSFKLKTDFSLYESKFTMLWSPLRETFKMPQSREGATLVTLKSKFILFGGFGLDFFNDIYTFDIVKNTWKEILSKTSKFLINDNPKPRQNHISVIYNDEMYI